MASISPTIAPTPQTELYQIGNLRYFGIVLGSLIALAVIFCAFFLVYRNRKARVIMVHQPLFLIMMCVGLFLWAISSIPASLDDSILSTEGCDRSCMAFQWLSTLGYSISFSALFAKLYRINKLFHGAARFQRVKVETTDVLWAVFVICGFNISLLILWTAIDPRRWVRDPVRESEPWITYGHCKSGRAGNGFNIAIDCVNFIALIMVCVQAWKARDISVEFNEAKYLGIALFNWLQLDLVSVPTEIVLQQDNFKALYTLEVSFLLMMCLSMLLLLFVPIGQQLRKYRRNPQQHSTNSRVHITGLTNNREQAHGISSFTGEGRAGGRRGSAIPTDNTEVTALKNRITTLEAEVEDFNQDCGRMSAKYNRMSVKYQDLEKRNKELEDQMSDEEKGENPSNPSEALGKDFSFNLHVETGSEDGPSEVEDFKVLALKNRISAPEAEVEDFNQDCYRVSNNQDLEKRKKELEHQICLEEEKGEKPSSPSEAGRELSLPFETESEDSTSRK